MKTIYLIFVCLIVSSTSANNCVTYLTLDEANQQSLDETQTFIAYLNNLFENSVVSTKELNHFKLEIEQNKNLTNPVPHKIIDGKLIFNQLQNQIHYDNIAAYLQSPNLNRKEILVWLTEFLRNQNAVEQEKRKTDAKTKYGVIPLNFYPIRGEGKLPYDFEMMNVPVTQYMWTKVMGTNPAHFNDGPHSQIVDIDGKKIKMQPNNPVENVTWFSALVFANRLSELHGYLPVYNLDKVNFIKGTHAEDGSLQYDSGGKNIIVNTNSENKKLGYRLPTVEEFLFVLTNKGEVEKGNYFPGMTEENKDQYAWSANNSQDQTHPVADLKPFTIDGNDFFDLYGNVGKWGHEFDAHSNDSIKEVWTRTLNLGCARFSVSAPTDYSPVESKARGLKSDKGTRGLILLRVLP